MIDFSTNYLGLKLKGPIVVASTPLSESLDNMRRMEDAGAAAIVLTSLFEEQLALESRALDEDLSRGTESFAESLDYLPDLSDYRMTHEVYLDHLRQAKAAVAIPIMASLNGATTGGWVRYARDMEEAGADAIELNTFALATDRSVEWRFSTASISPTSTSRLWRCGPRCISPRPLSCCLACIGQPSSMATPTPTLPSPAAFTRQRMSSSP